MDIPKGQFICIYAGAILSDEGAEEIGKEDAGGDEYFADMDLIGSVETEKEGYESEERDSTDDNEDHVRVIDESPGYTDFFAIKRQINIGTTEGQQLLSNIELCRTRENAVMDE